MQYYSFAAPNAPFRKTDGYCQSKGQNIQFFDHKTSSSKAVSVIICLEPMTFTNKNKDKTELIPYKTDPDGMTWGAKPYSAEFYTYETQVKKRFTMTATEEEALIREAEKHWRDEFTEAMAYLAAGLAIFGALVCATGWIMRGFLGIPRGMDKRPDL